MTCREVTDFLMDYVDRTLAADSRAVFDHHLSICPACRDYLQSYKTTVGLERQALCEAETGLADPPAELVAAILASRRLESPRTAE